AELSRHGRWSCGGATQLLACTDGWIAVSLARPDDIELLPAWLGTHDLVAGTCGRAGAELVALGGELGIPCARLGEVTAERPAFAATRLAAGPPRPIAGAVVVDLSSLWAGPLCGHLLTIAGARTIKVESTRRPDGGRTGPAGMYDLLHTGQASVALDFSDPSDRRRLAALLATADVVIEASRPRALAQLGVDAAAVASSGRTVWVSITGYGRDAPGASRVAFGDDAAVAGGLVAVDAVGGPVFCADAIADPLSGLVAAAATLDALRSGGGWLVDVSMSGVAAWCARRRRAPAPVSTAWAGPVGAPRARPIIGTAPALGADNRTVFRDLDIP
ncbi:MAG: CoA transferase, partial [Ilumatobacteraceae bacterium]